jgi:hypothetical protein
MRAAYNACKGKPQSEVPELSDELKAKVENLIKEFEQDKPEPKIATDPLEYYLLKNKAERARSIGRGF